MIEYLLASVLGASGRVKRTLGVFHDILVASAVLFISYAAIFGVWPTLQIPYIFVRVGLFGVAGGVIFLAFALNRGAWRYASVFDVVAIAKASFILTAGYAIASFLYDRGAYLTRAQPIVIFSLLVTGLGATRMAFRLAKEGRLGPMRNAIPVDTRAVLLYGLNEDTEMFLRALSRNRQAPLKVVGVVEDTTRNLRTRIHGVKVIGHIDDVDAIVERNKRRGVELKELVVGDRGLDRHQLSRIVKIASSAGLTVSLLPEATLTRHVGAKTLEPTPVNLADVLGRPEVELSTTDIATMIDGKCVLITGAGGSIGSELARQVSHFNPARLVLTDNSEHMLFSVNQELTRQQPTFQIDAIVADVRDQTRINSVFTRVKPEVIFHAAALKHVPIVENNPVEAIKTNLLGTRNVANAAIEAGAKSFVLISTDKAVNPRSIMGATKRAAEIYCQSMDVKSTTTRLTTVRFGNVIGSNGSVVPIFQNQIARGGPVTVTHPHVMRYFMSIPEAVRLVLQASASGLRASNERGQVLVLQMGDPISIAELAEKMIQLAGFKPGVDIEITYTGLRPGEKLVEELASDRETVAEFSGRGYNYVTSPAADDRLLQKILSDIHTAIVNQDDEIAMKLLQHLVPSYRRWEQAAETVAISRPDSKYAQ